MNAIEFLEKQHREVEALFGQLDKLGEKASKDKKAIFSEIAHKLDVHTKIEEKILYPLGKKVDEDTTLEAYEEHAVAKSLIKKIEKMRPQEETFMARVTVLKEIIEHHVKEEEEEYFPELRKSLGDEKLEEIGAVLEAAVEKLESRPTKKARSVVRPQRRGSKTSKQTRKSA